MRFPSMLRRLRNTQAGMRSTARSGSTPYTPYTDPPPGPFGVDAGDAQTVSVGTAVTFTGTVSNAPAGATLTYLWAFGDEANPTAGGSGVRVPYTYTTTGAKTVRLTVSYTDTNGELVEASDEVIITVIEAVVPEPPSPEQDPPAAPGAVPIPPVSPSTLQVTVMASSPTTYRGVRITFTGSVENAPEGVTLSYSWTFGDGATDTQGINGLISSCKYDTLGDKTVTLTVRNGNTVLGSGSVTINVESPPLPWLPPVARAGMNQVVAFGSEVSFSGADSTSPYGGSLTYSWVFGADADPATSNAVMPFCTYRKPGTKMVRLTVTDRVTELRDTDEVTIKVKPLPVAEAGDDQIVGKGQKVSFDGSGSTGIDIDYLWDFGDETNPTASSDEIMPSYRYNPTGTETVTLTVTLTVTDRDTGVTAKDYVTIKVKPVPVANAGDDQTVAVGDTVSFNGLDSTTTNLSYSWVFGADAAPLTGSGATPSCTYNEPGAKTVMLTVTDRDTGLTAKNYVTINVGVVARAGSDQTVAVDDTVSFNGLGSIGTNLSYSWDFGADAAPLTGSGATPSCTYSAPGAKIVTLTVMNTVTKVTDSDEVTINVEPVARAGSNQIVVVGNTVSFDGSDSVGTNLTYLWDFSDEAHPTAGGSGRTPSYTYTTTGVKMVSLTVTEGEGEQSRSNTDTLTVTVTSIQTTGPRGVNHIEGQALKLTFGEDVGEFLIGQIIIKFPDGLKRARVPTLDERGNTNVTEIDLKGDHDLAKLGKLGTFIHEATHIWQRNTGLHQEGVGGRDYEYTLDQLLSLDLKVEKHAHAVQGWFIANYAYTHGSIGDGPGQFPASFVWGDSLQSILGYSHEAIGKMPDSEKIRVINFYYKRLIDQIQDSTLLPSTDTED